MAEVVRPEEFDCDLAEQLAGIRRVASALDLLPLLAIAVGLVLMAVTARPVVAQTPDEVQAEIEAQAGPLAPCLLSIAAREDPPLNPYQPNLQGSGAFGLFQIMPQTYASTPVSQQVPLAVAGVAEQVEAASYLLMSGWASAWNPLPQGC